MKVMTGELAPRASEAKAPVQLAAEGRDLRSEVQPSGDVAPALSGKEATKEAVSVSEAARHALEKKSLPVTMTWDAAVQELRDQILAKMLDSMHGKSVNFADLGELYRLADPSRRPISSLDGLEEASPEEVHASLEVESVLFEGSAKIVAEDGELELAVSLQVPKRELAERGLVVGGEEAQPVREFAFPGELAQLPSENFQFHMDVAAVRPLNFEPDDIAEPEVTSGEEEIAVRVWSVGETSQGGFVGTVGFETGGFSLSRPEGNFSQAETPVPARQALGAYQDGEALSLEDDGLEVIL